MAFTTGPGFLASLNGTALTAAIQAATAVKGVVLLGTLTTSKTLDLTAGTFLTGTLTASTACTFTMPTLVAGSSFDLFLRQAPSTGNGTATFTNVKWGTAGAPTITATAGTMDKLHFDCDGTDWFGNYVQGFTPTVPGLSDDFNRANSTSAAGPNWTNRNNTVGVTSNAAYPVSSGYCAASYNTTLANNNQTVSITIGALVGSGTDVVMAFCGANTTGEAVILYLAGTTIAIAQQATWALGGFGILSSASTSYVPGDVYRLDWIGGVAAAYKNGVYTGLAAGPTVTQDSSHRLAGLVINGSGSNYRTIDAWSAA